MSALEPILRATREAVARRRIAVPLERLEQAPAMPGGGGAAFVSALRAPGVSLIAEHKRRSPSGGSIREGSSLRDVVEAYERAGAAALSVLTEEPHFGGSLEDLRCARAVSALPILRKDFTVDPYQLHESRACGADAILLIVAALTRAELAELHALAGALGLTALVEVHDSNELELALELGAPLIGVNNRDLRTLEVDTGRTLQLRSVIPPGTVVVAESGFRTRAELDALSAAGIDAVLIGEALMRSPDIEAACRALTGRG